jgi:hypothetical protein
MSLFVHNIKATPQDNGLYGMPLSIKSYTIYHPKWEIEFLISVTLIALCENNPDKHYKVEQFDNFLLVIDENDDRSCIFYDYIHFYDSVFYYANKYKKEEVDELNNIRRKHKLETILE